MKIETRKDIESIIDNEIIAKYSIDVLNKINDGVEVYYRNFLKFAMLRFDLMKKGTDIKINKFLKIIKKIINNVRNKEEIFNLIDMYLGVSEDEKKLVGEVFTPIYNKRGSVDEQLKLLPKDFWSNPDVKVFDPCCGIGNYEVVAIENFMNGLKEWEPNEEKRYKHIIENQIYVCELQTKNMFSYLNIFDPNCEYDMKYHKGDFLDNNFSEVMKQWGIKKFDLVMMNSPYQETLIAKKGSAKPLYNRFIEKSLLLSNKVISIHPSRWMAGGKGLEKFRKMMLNRTDIKSITTIKDATEVFGKDVEIEGGVQFILIDKEYNGICYIDNFDVNLNKFDIVPTILSTEAMNIINKVETSKNLSKICIGQSYSGINSNDIRLNKNKIKDNDIKCYVSKVNGFIKYIDKDKIKNISTINKWKVITARANGSKKIFGNKFIGSPGEICNQSYIVFIVDTERESKNLLIYLNTKFANFMLGLRKISQDIKPDTCKWIPLIDLSKTWTDKELYNYFNLTKDEIDLIEKTVK